MSSLPLRVGDNDDSAQCVPPAIDGPALFPPACIVRKETETRQGAAEAHEERPTADASIIDISSISICPFAMGEMHRAPNAVHGHASHGHRARQPCKALD